VAAVLRLLTVSGVEHPVEQPVQRDGAGHHLVPVNDRDQGTVDRASTDATSNRVTTVLTAGSSVRFFGSRSATVRSPMPSKMTSAAASSTTRASAGSSWQ
jgi:hypothetical protein